MLGWICCYPILRLIVALVRGLIPHLCRHSYVLDPRAFTNLEWAISQKGNVTYPPGPIQFDPVLQRKQNEFYQHLPNGRWEKKLRENVAKCWRPMGTALSFFFDGFYLCTLLFRTPVNIQPFNGRSTVVHIKDNDLQGEWGNLRFDTPHVAAWFYHVNYKNRPDPHTQIKLEDLKAAFVLGYPMSFFSTYASFLATFLDLWILTYFQSSLPIYDLESSGLFFYYLWTTFYASRFATCFGAIFVEARGHWLYPGIGTALGSLFGGLFASLISEFIVYFSSTLLVFLIVLLCSFLPQHFGPIGLVNKSFEICFQ